MNQNHTTAYIETDFCNGGGLVFLVNLSGELARRGEAWRVFSLSDVSPPPARFRKLGIPTTMEPAKGVLFEDKIHQVLKQLAAVRPTIVAVKIGNETAELLRYLPAGIFRVGIVHSEAQLEVAAKRAGMLDCLVTVSDYNREQLEKLTPPGTRVSKLDLGIPLSGKTTTLSVRPDQPLRILYLGSLVRRAKRVQVFPDILARLQAADIPFVWTIAGEGPDRAWLEAQLRPAAAHQQVVFTGHVEQEQVPDLLAAQDILLLTSDTETFSLALHEAMAAGVVPVVSDIPGRVRFMVTPERGIRVPLEPGAGYADAILRLHADRELLRRLSGGSRAAIGRECSVEAMADRWLALLPPPPARPPEWPAKFRIQAPLFAQNKRWWFSPPARMVRRVVARVSAR